MVIFKTIKGIKKFLSAYKNTDKIIGYVPTMGALHSGHVSLIENCNANADLTVCSIFVNPTQFNDKKDFENYPITIEKDIQLLYEMGCDILFLPSASELYPDSELLEHYELGFLETILEGKFRPGHFQGVCQVVNRLLKVVEPQRLFMGQKDFQQCLVIRKLLELTASNTDLFICPTVREESGLAKSSRNVRLSDDEKSKATIIYQSLLFAKENITSVPINELELNIKENLLQMGFDNIDYIAFCNTKSLNTIIEYHANENLVVLIAATINNVRLIDNLILN